MDEKTSLSKTSSVASSVSPRSRKRFSLDTPRKRKLRKQIATLHSSVKKLKHKEVKKCDSGEFVDIKDFPVFLKSLIRHAKQNTERNKQGQRYDDDLKEMCLSIYFKSPACYRMIQDKLMLPSESTLNRFICEFDLHEGINDNLMAFIKQKMLSFEPEDRICSLSFDEMAIEEKLVYCKKNRQNIWLCIK